MGADVFFHQMFFIPFSKSKYDTDTVQVRVLASNKTHATRLNGSQVTFSDDVRAHEVARALRKVHKILNTLLQSAPVP